MIRLLHAYFPTRTLVLWISEACLISMAFLAVTVARLGVGPAALMLNYHHGSLKILVVSAAIIICMYYFDLYDSAILGNRRKVPIRLAQVLGTVYIVLALLYYFYPPLDLGAGIFVVGLVFVAMLLFCWRKLFDMVNSVTDFADRAVILGDGPLAELLQQECESRPEFGLRVVGRVLPFEIGNNQSDGRRGETSGDLFGIEMNEILPRAIKTFRANRIVVAMDERRGKLPVEMLLSMKCRGVHVQDGVEVYETITGKVPIECTRLASLLFSPGFYASRFHLFYKRFASVLVSILGLLVALPLLPFVVFAIKLTSPGPVLYRQRRVGRDGNVFHCYKFRTMRADAEADTGPTWAMDDDPRITPVGHFLRKTRLDEIPQLWNVLTGDMSLVGPRPERPEFVSGLSREIPYYFLRHSIRPGITGWAQIRYRYGNTVEDAKEKLRYDLFYIKNMSMGLDLLIFLSTIKVIILGTGAK
ncbi:MAG: TIGR03013 family PEP-CTERM/XrtA system glycosyltransferase [Acidobacteriia bacterium]|nr:TIGR03013 family PEP-CTERM/XrtA system glycosyltransferase [Terriglobia bacterium]